MKLFYYLFLLPIIVCMMSCSHETKSQWEKTEDGKQIFVGQDKSLINSGKFSWSGDTTYLGIAVGKGIYEYTDKLNKEDNVKKSTTAYYGTFIEPRNLNSYEVGSIEDGKLNGFGVRVRDGEAIIGSAQKGKFKGECYILHNDTLYYHGNLKESRPSGVGKSHYPDGKVEYSGEWENGKYDGHGILFSQTGIKLYKGDWKNGKYNGEGVLYTSSGKKIYEGHWKDGKYNGFGTDYASHHPVSHVWKNGGLDKVTANYYNYLNENKRFFTATQYEKIVERALSWEKYHGWQYAGIIASLAFILLCMAVKCESTIDSNPFFRASPWRPWPYYLCWLFGGWIGLHRAALRSRICYVYMVCFAIVVCVEIRDIVHYLFWPSTWFMWHFSIISIVCMAIIGVMLIADLIWIPIQCLRFNHIYYRHDFREEFIMSGQESDVEPVYRNVPVVMNNALSKLPNYINKAKAINRNHYSGKTTFFAKVGRAVTGNTEAVKFEMARLRSIENVYNNAAAVQNKVSEEAELMNERLAEARTAAYRNFYLAKELIGKVKHSKGKKQTIVSDDLIDDTYYDEICLSSSVDITNIGIDFDSLVGDSISCVSKLSATGLSKKWSVGLGIGTAVVGAISKAVEREDKARESANKMCEEVLKQLRTLLDTLTVNEAKLLRSAEILEALYAANKAFVYAYAPLRDRVFGEDFKLLKSMTGYKLSKSDAQDPEFIKAVFHLAAVCKEYNKINQSK